MDQPEVREASPGDCTGRSKWQRVDSKYLILHKNGGRCDTYPFPIDEHNFAQACAYTHGSDVFVVQLFDVTYRPAIRWVQENRPDVAKAWDERWKPK